MPFQLSPGVLVVEKDLTSIIPAVATSTGAFAGTFVWGPVLEPTQVTSEQDLVQRFGKPYDANAASFYTAANFLAYSNNLQLVRISTSGQKNAVSGTVGSLDSVTITNGGYNYVSGDTISFTNVSNDAVALLQVRGGAQTVVGVNVTTVGTGYDPGALPGVVISAPDSGTQAEAVAVVNSLGELTGINVTVAGDGYLIADYEAGITVTIDEPDVEGGTQAVAEVVLGGSIIGVEFLSGGSGYSGTVVATVATTPDTGGADFACTVNVVPTGIVINNEDDYLENYANGEGTTGMWAAKYPGALGNSLKVSIADADTAGLGDWVDADTGVDYSTFFDNKPSSSPYVVTATGVENAKDELHIVVIDKDGLWSGTRGTVLEKFAYVSKASDAKRTDGSDNYYKNVINNSSKYIWWLDHPSSGLTGTTEWGVRADLASTTSAYKVLTAAQTSSLAGGVDDLTASAGEVQIGFDPFVDSEKYDISLVMTGKVTPATAKYIVENIVEARKDCIAFISASDANGEMLSGGDVLAETLTFRNTNCNLNSSYAVFDSGFKYQYDKHNDLYRWVPLNGDIAGLCARTDYTNDPWWSPGGFNRGIIKNVIKLSFNPNKAQRDDLYKAGINPVVSFPGQGCVLYGDKTALAKPSAFDRINVRRLFIVLEKAIAIAAKYQLFELNDKYTRARFRTMIEPFLRDVQGRRGVIDFRVICNEINNTGEVIDRNEFIADILIKPTRSINFITLNFVAVRTGVSFDEIGA